MYLVCNRKIDGAIFSSKLVDDLACGFNMIAPFYHYLQKIQPQGQHFKHEENLELSEK